MRRIDATDVIELWRLEAEFASDRAWRETDKCAAAEHGAGGGLVVSPPPACRRTVELPSPSMRLESTRVRWTLLHSQIRALL
jgi:hypothetical protein